MEIVNDGHVPARVLRSSKKPTQSAFHPCALGGVPSTLGAASRGMTLKFRLYFNFLALKFKYLAPKIKYVAHKLKYVAPKIKYLTPNSNQSIFVPLKTSRFVRGNLPTWPV